MTNEIVLFEGKKIRRHYDEKTETWYFSVVDIIQVLDQTSLIFKLPENIGIS